MQKHREDRSALCHFANDHIRLIQPFKPAIPAKQADPMHSSTLSCLWQFGADPSQWDIGAGFERLPPE